MTPKREKFVLAYLETGSASEAYRQAFNAAKMKAETIHKRASELLAQGEVAGRIEALRSKAAEAVQMTIEGHLEDLKRIRDLAMRDGNFAPAVTAEIARGKVSGFYTDRLKIDDERDRMSDDELRRRVVEKFAELGINGPGKPVTH